MNLLTFILRLRQTSFNIPVKLYKRVQSIARRKGMTPWELLAELLEEAEMLNQIETSLPGRWERLTPREKQTVYLVCRKLTNQEIAHDLGISLETVKCHLGNAMEKLDLHSRYMVQQALDGFDFPPGCHHAPKFIRKDSLYKR